jgi:hypothetical protein
MSRFLIEERSFLSAYLMRQNSKRREKVSLCLPDEQISDEERSFLSAYLMRQNSKRREKLSLCLPYETDF